MEKQNQDLFEFLREIKIEKIISDYQKTYPNLEKELENLKNNIFQNNNLKNLFNENKLFSCKNNKLIFEELCDSIFNIIMNNQNESYDKMRKYVLLYFLYGLIIYYKNTKIKELNSTMKMYNFFKKNEIDWLASSRGPIIRTFYKFGEQDKQILINISKLKQDDKEFELFKVGIFTIEKYSTNMLIEESYKTDPWFNNYKKNKKLKIISSSNIGEYFSNHPPFFIDNKQEKNEK